MFSFLGEIFASVIVVQGGKDADAFCLAELK